MIAIYNESKINWTTAKINDKTSKITTFRTLNDGKVRYLDVLVSGEISTPEINNCVNMTESQNCNILYDGNTSVKFKSRDLKPFIAKSDRFNTDVLLINIALKGNLIKNMSKDSSILAYLIAKGELFLIVSLSDRNENMKFEVTLHDPHAVTDTTYTFEKENGQYTVNTNMVQTDTVISKPSYKINRFRPARPTNVIFVNKSDEKLMMDLLRYPDSHKIMIVEDGNVDDMLAQIEPLKQNGYKAATLYVNSEDFTGSNDEHYGEEYDTLRNNFKFLNILLNNGKVMRR